MSGGAANSRTISGVRMRSAPGSRRPRPMSIATTGMTSSMYEERQKPAHFVRDKSCTLTNFLYFPFKVLSSAFYKLREFCFGFSILYSFLTGGLISIWGWNIYLTFDFSEHSKSRSYEESPKRDERLCRSRRRQWWREVRLQRDELRSRSQDSVTEDSKPGQSRERCQEGKGEYLYYANSFLQFLLLLGFHTQTVLDSEVQPRECE